MLLRTNKKTEEEDQGGLPIPTQFISNGEFWPVPQTPAQRTIERLIHEMADERARKLGWSRRRFLGSAAGMATALMAINIVSGCGNGDDDSGGFCVGDADTRDPDAACETFQADYFIMDVQTHHADLEGSVGMNPVLGEFFRNFRICGPEGTTPDCTRRNLQELSRANYIKEMFLDSETAVAIMSGLPAPSAFLQLIGNAAMAETRDYGNQLGSSERMLTQGMLTPNFPAGNDARTNLEDMDWMVEELGIRALKTYTGAGAGPNYPSGQLNPWVDSQGNSIPPWLLDDEDIAYPMFEKAVQLGINIVNTHKGLPLGIFDPEFLHPRDLPKAVRDWPQLNFVVYHSGGFEYLDELVQIKQEQLADVNTLYAELGAIFASAVVGGVNRIAELLGKLVRAFGPNRILWGTDSIWYGTPQWQINALKTFRMPQEFLDQGYPDITDDVKRQIFGRNAAQLYCVNPEALRCDVVLPDDMIAKARQVYPDVAQPSLRQYGFKTRREFFKHAFSGKNPLA